MTTSDLKLINRDYQRLAPFFAELLKIGLAQCRAENLSIDLFEGYRSPSRQIYLASQNTADRWVTNATAWESWHQYGLAADLAFKVNGQWKWSQNDPWAAVHKIFHALGFETLSKEKGHFQISGGMSIEQAYKIYRYAGIETLWLSAKTGYEKSRQK